jgi:hypothetical protein
VSRLRVLSVARKCGTGRTGRSSRSVGVRVVVLRDAEPAPNSFGLAWFRLWCRRDDTGKEGYCTFGPDGVV